jgi:MFS transporter, Spinster family, sphingosine-1-phosphate transporter
MKSESSKKIRWMALLVLTGINLLNYIDRYIFSALLPAIKADLGFTDTQLGFLGSGFIFAYLFISPVFGFLGDRGGRSKVMATGVMLWSVATAFSGIAMSYTTQMVTRIAVGLGESAYSVIAPSTIADHFPKSTRGKVFAIYAGAIPVGSALGYVLGGVLEPILGWRHSFFVVGIPGCILAMLLFFMRDPKRGEADEEAGDVSADLVGEKLSLAQSYRVLLTNGGFMMTVLGYAAYTFVVGGMAFWMPTYIVRYFEVSLAKGNTVFGAVTVAGGFIGTLVGGWWADRMEKKSGNGFLKVCAFSMVAAVPLFFLTLSMTTFSSFAIALFFMEIALFLCMSPLDAAVLGYVRPSLRATAMALNVFLIHLLGDGISRVLMGAVSDASDLRAAIGLLPWVLVLAGVFWQIGIILYWQPLAWPKDSFSLPKWQAHRGYRPTSDIQENSIAAFTRAMDEGAEMIECDVHLTRDGKVVLFHDLDLKRMAADNRKVGELTAEEMWNLAKAPLLTTVLRAPGIPPLINIELKTAEVRGPGRLERAVVDAIKETGAEGRVLFSSFNPFCLRKLSKMLPDVPRALLASDIREYGNTFYLRKLWLAFIARPHLVHLEKGMFTASRTAAWIERGVPLAAWTVNDPAEAERLLHLGVKSVITDNLYARQS